MKKEELLCQNYLMYDWNKKAAPNITTEAMPKTDSILI
jgi:hypothetical protein